MLKTSRIYAILMTLFIITTISACNPSTDTMTIPAVNESNITETANTLGITVEDFETYLSCMNTSYDAYIDMLNTQNQSLTMLKTSIESNYDCTFKEYIDTFILVNNQKIPNENDYTLFKSQYSLFDAYIPNNKLNDNRNGLRRQNIAISIADTSEDAYAFDIIATCNNDLASYANMLTDKYGCVSCRLSTITLHGNYGVRKTSETNACLDNFFTCNENNEVLEQFTLPVLTLCYENTNQNITLALSNELGLIFKTTGMNSYKQMQKLNELPFQIRRVINR